MILAMIILITTMWGGLSRLGFPSPPIFEGVIQNHGFLMIGGFLGTLIGLERALALKLWWPWLVPLGAVLGGIILLFGFYTLLSGLLITISGAIMTIVFIYIFYRQSVAHNALLALAAFCWFIGSTLWTIGWPVHRLVYWLMGFLVLTITAERLELNRILILDKSKKMSLIGANLLFLSSLALSLIFEIYGNILIGFSMIVLATWLLLFDIAGKTMTLSGEKGFVGRALFIGYLWLGLGGILLVIFPTASAGYIYGSILHVVFLGFVFSMIFGHSLTIFPAVVNLPVSYHPVLYIPFILLHFSIAVRLFGNYLQAPNLRLSGGILNTLAILIFFPLLIITTIKK